MSNDRKWGYAPNGWALVPRWLVILVVAVPAVNLAITAASYPSNLVLADRMVAAEKRISELEAVLAGR